MKSEDFDRLKAVCKKEGFEILNLTHDDNEKYVIVKKQKDTWEKVEFVTPNHNSTASKLPYKVVGIENGFVQVYCPYSGSGGISQIQKSELNTSDELSYVGQLKVEAFKKFGKINDGDKFQTEYGVNVAKINYPEFDYNKHIDYFRIFGVIVYSQGVWSTRIKERVKVEFFNDALDEHEGLEQWGFYFKIQNHNYGSELSKESGSFLASKLEEYLNKE